ncbi:MAG: transposase, partial [Candidatus Pacebacteria bacterium]|nr:transposase [Candidatus Paceibacterota bacterium]
TPTIGQRGPLTNCLEIVYDVVMERHVPFEEGEYYHVYNRGVDKRKIFFSEGDWNHFMWLLFARNSEGHIRAPRKKPQANGQRGSLTILPMDANRETLVDICAYALMDNHFHLLLKEKQEGGISKFMGKLLTAFALYMNTKYDRTGPLMCRPFRAKHIDSDEYLRWVISYIHLNPVDQVEPKWKEFGVSSLKETQEFLSKYKYSSYSDYFTIGQRGSLTTRQEGAIINKDALPIDISDLDNLKEMLEEYSSHAYLDEEIDTV